MRIILVGYVSTVKRLRISLGTLVAIEATSDASPSDDTGATLAADAELTACNSAQFMTNTPGVAAEAAVGLAFAAIERINRLMHPTAEGSNLARINSAALHVPTSVHASVGQLLNLARRLNTLTDGVFDPCTPAQPGRLSNIEVSADETEVVCHARVALDFGGFAKGYAVDCAIEALKAAGCTAGLVNAGGDMRVFGQHSGPVFVRGTGGELINIGLTDAALAVSDVTAQQRPPEHQGYYVRGTTPGAQTAVEYATTYAAVTADTAVIADALAKCVLLCPPSAAERVLRAFGASHYRL
jgi:FAD:protein FMN transferase